MAYFRMELESLSENEEFARVVTAVFMSRMNPTLEQVEDVKTAVSEAVTNAVIHGYQNGEGIILLEGRTEGDWLTVTVEDHGVGIRDVKRAMEPLYTTDRTGERSGMGFSFMETFMDEVEVESEQGKGTLVRMRKEIRQEVDGREEQEKWELEEGRSGPESIPVTIQTSGPESRPAAVQTSSPDALSVAVLAGRADTDSHERAAGIEETACTVQSWTRTAGDGTTGTWAAGGGAAGTAGMVNQPEAGQISPGVGAPMGRSRTARVIQSILSVQP